jgi:hypothetical protein
VKCGSEVADSMQGDKNRDNPMVNLRKQMKARMKIEVAVESLDVPSPLRSTGFPWPLPIVRGSIWWTTLNYREG